MRIRGESQLALALGAAALAGAALWIAGSGSPPGPRGGPGPRIRAGRDPELRPRAPVPPAPLPLAPPAPIPAEPERPRDPGGEGGEAAPDPAVRGGRVLIVVDRVTGAPLPAARAFLPRRERDRQLYRDHPGATTLAGEPREADAEGRISLADAPGEEWAFVVAPGHAWRRVHFPPDGPGETRVDLGPGGAVRVAVPRWGSLEGAHLLMEAENGTWWPLPGVGPDGAATYQGLPAGRATFSVIRGPAFRGGEVYGTGTVLVSPGAETSLVLVTDPSKAGKAAPLAGRIAVPAAWGFTEVSLAIRGEDSTNADVDERMTLALPADGTPAPFETRPVPPGIYSVEIAPQSLTEVRFAPGDPPLDLALPEPAEIRVRILDLETGATVERARVAWHMVDPGRRTHRLERAPRDGGTGEWIVRCPPGEVEISVHADGYAIPNAGPPGGEAALEVPAGSRTARTLRIGRAGSVRISFTWAGETPHWATGSVSLWEKGRGEGVEVGEEMALEDASARFEEVAPGTYRLEIDAPDGFEPVPDREVTVLPGEEAAVPVRLVRRE